MLVEPPEEEWQPTAVSFQERHFEVRVALEDARACEAGHAQHLLNGVAEGVAQHEVLAELPTHLRQTREDGLVEPEGHAELFQRVPEGFVIWVMPGTVVDHVGPQENGAEPQLFDDPPRFGNGVVYVEYRNHARAQKPLRVRLAEVEEPVVVGTGDCCCECGIHIRFAQGMQAAAWVDDRHVDALDVHRFQLDLVTVATVGVRPVTVLHLFGVLSGGTTGGHPPERVPSPEASVRVDEVEVGGTRCRSDRCNASEARVDVPLPEVHRLDDVHVAVDNLETVLRHQVPPHLPATELRVSRQSLAH